jgi:hypothetical protein
MARKSPEVNAGSMADIAFLLLIFFLVTTTIETDSGINRKLPPMEELIDPPVIKERNIFTVVVNKNNMILVEEKLMDLSEVRSAAVKFLDNGGGLGEEACNYCEGEKIDHHLIILKKQLFLLKTTEKLTIKFTSLYKMN